jgi:hypothetical protein
VTSTRLVEALAGKKMIGAVSGHDTAPIPTPYTVAWTEEEARALQIWGSRIWGTGPRRARGCVFAGAGRATGGKAGGWSGSKWCGLRKRSSSPLGKKVVGSLATEGKEAFAKAGGGAGWKEVIGASAGREHTSVWTVAGELFTFWEGQYGMLGHGGVVGLCRGWSSGHLK